ncbi:Mpo1-like protein [Pseudoalteromonas ruthenica]|uniref:Mpo1-like protein n=1 Tax=Pseudoalteromonas ruthenica TaxID=151081 RepID=UPI00241F5B78|nr:Mpo1-like protein [Pseudoalteromonas ruthenica]|tara:strand:- start:80117 stop:80437 length:321 start_codon:yes stop_codon:yes gene_type:complete
MPQAIDKKNFNSFKAFYPYYLQEHENPVCRRLHFIGSLVVLAILGFAVFSGSYIWLWAMPVAGYGFAWVGHFFFEKNRPATFRHPVYSLIGDWVMFKGMLIGKVPW